MKSGIQHKDYYTGFDSRTFLNLPELKQKVDASFNDIDLLDAAVFWMTNIEREKHGLKPFLFCEQLGHMANGHSTQMRLHHFFSHENPYDVQYKTLTDRLHCVIDHNFGGFMTYGENIALYPTLKGPETFTIRLREHIPHFYDANGNELCAYTCLEFAQSIVEGWMNSPGHRANILNPSFEYLGCGCAEFEKVGKYASLLYYYLTQNFGGGIIPASSTHNIRRTINPRAENFTNLKFNASFGGWRQQLHFNNMNTNEFNGDIMPGGYSPENGEEKTLCVFLLDNSGSMGDNNKINALNNGMQQFHYEILSNETTSQKLEICIIVFNSKVVCLQPPALAQDIIMQTLKASGGTDMVGAILKAMEVIKDRKRYWKEHGVAYKRPWIVMITDGYANVDSIKDQVKQESAAKHFFFLPIAVDDGADMNVLNSLASNKAFKLGEGKFSSFFQWLSNSMATIANADGPTAQLENPFETFAV